MYYTVASGVGVFASGTMRWVCAMRGPHCGHGHPARNNLTQVKPPCIAALYDGID